MSFLTPLFLLLGLLAGPIILLYMLRLRRQEMMVSSTLLWQKLLRDREANAPWQRLRRNLLLLLQLLILLALVLALARPFLPVPTVVSGSVVVMLDGSASMQATDVEPNRFEAARQQAYELIDNLSGGDQMTLILVGPTPTVLAAATGDRGVLRDALAAAAPTSAPADWNAAIALATGAAQGFRDARIAILSDGGLPDDLPPLPAEIVYVPIGAAAENLAISALATRATAAGPQLFVSVVNHGPNPESALLSLTLDGTLYDSRRLDVPGAATASLTWELPAGTSAIQAQLSDMALDYLALDDVAWAVHEGGASNQALILTEGNLFLEQIFTALPNIEAFKAPPTTDIYAEGADPFDLYVFDGVPLPEPAPAADMLLLNPVTPAGSEPLFTVSGVFSDTAVTRLSDSPLLQFVDFNEINILQAKNVVAPWAETVVGSAGGPLLMAGERAGHRIAILTFDLHQSDLPLRVAFPILMANITNWLRPGRAVDTDVILRPGDPVTLAPGASTTTIVVTKPDDTLWLAPVAEGDLFFTETEQQGLYQVALRDDAGEQPAGQFAINLFAPAESAIAPVSGLQIGQTDVASSDGDDVGQRELWPWLAALALVVLLVEWWVYHRGTRRPTLLNPRAETSGGMRKKL